MKKLNSIFFLLFLLLITGGFAAIAQNAFDPEDAINFEAGFKSLLLDRRLQINTTAFLTNYDDLQVTFFTVPLGSSATFGEFFTENASSAKIQGLEIEFLALPAESFEIGGSLAFLDTEYEDFLTETVVAPNRCTAGDAVFVDPDDISQGCRLDFSGNDLRQAPEFSANLFAKYTWAMPSGSTLAFKVDTRYQDDSFYDPDSSPLTLIPSYTLVDASIAYTSASGAWRVALWAKNLTDEDYVTHIFSQRGGTVSFANYGPPQQLGLTFTYDYGN